MFLVLELKELLAQAQMRQLQALTTGQSIKMSYIAQLQIINLMTPAWILTEDTLMLIMINNYMHHTLKPVL